MRRLAITWLLKARGIEPLFPFGHGLSYTTLTLSQLTVTRKNADGSAPMRIAFTMPNTGQRAGAEVAQVYLGLPAAAIALRESITIHRRDHK